MTKYICAVAGKSGGHIIPTISLCQKILQDSLKDYPDYKIIFFSTNSKLDNEIISKYNFIDNHIKLNISNLSKNPIKLIKFSYNFILSFFYSFKILKKIKPEKVISTGGLVSIPICIAANILKIPVELYELNVIPGKASRFLSKLSLLFNYNIKIFTVFTNTCNYFNNKNCKAINYPVRFKDQDIISQKDALIKINQELEIDLKFEENKKTLFIIGGSQGSVNINNIIKDFFTKNLNTNSYQVIHQTGNLQVSELKEFYKLNNIANKVFDFQNNLETYYCAADIIISRAGAGSIFEILFFAKKLENKKIIIIPLENTADDHQLENAKEISKQYPDIFVVKRQGNLNPEDLLIFS